MELSYMEQYFPCLYAFRQIERISDLLLMSRFLLAGMIHIHVPQHCLWSLYFDVLARVKYIGE